MNVPRILLVFHHGLCLLGETPGTIRANKTDVLLGVNRTVVPSKVD